MSEICEICGLPKNLCVCREIDKSSQKIRIKTARTRFRKIVTVISGIDEKEKAEELGKAMKRKLACGGTVKDNVIELQGDHRKRVKEELMKQGYKEELIEDA